MGASLAVAWELTESQGSRICEYDVPLLAARPAAPDPRGPRYGPPPYQLLRAWDCSRMVVGVHWLEGSALVVLSERGAQTWVDVYGEGELNYRLIFYRY